MSRDSRRRKPSYGSRHHSGYQFGSRQGDYLGADNPNWREHPPENPPQKPQLSTVHLTCTEFLQKGWDEVNMKKESGAVKVLQDEANQSAPITALDIEAWIQNKLTPES